MKKTTCVLLLTVALAHSVMPQYLSGGAGFATTAVSNKIATAMKRFEFVGTPLEGWQATLRMATNAFPAGSDIQI